MVDDVVPGVGRMVWPDRQRAACPFSSVAQQEVVGPDRRKGAMELALGLKCRLPTVHLAFSSSRGSKSRPTSRCGPSRGSRSASRKALLIF